MGMDTVFWLVAIVVFVVAEAATTALISIWFAAGAAVAMVVSLFTASLGIQFLVFAVVSAVALAIMVVLRAILPGEIGRVRVDGLDWQARADAALPEGSKCRVADVDGAVLIVEALPDPAKV